MEARARQGQGVIDHDFKQIEYNNIYMEYICCSKHAKAWVQPLWAITVCQAWVALCMQAISDASFHVHPFGGEAHSVVAASQVYQYIGISVDWYISKYMGVCILSASLCEPCVQ